MWEEPNLENFLPQLPIAARGLQVPLQASPTQLRAQLRPSHQASTLPEHDQRNPTKPKQDKHRQQTAKLQSRVSSLKKKLSSKCCLVEQADKLLCEEKAGGEPLNKKDRAAYKNIMDLYNSDKKALLKLEEKLKTARLLFA